MHPMWMQTAVRTARLSCRKPNMQQIPTGSIYGVSPRHVFTLSCKETCLFAFDYNPCSLINHHHQPHGNHPIIITMKVTQYNDVEEALDSTCCSNTTVRTNA